MSLTDKVLHAREDVLSCIVGEGAKMTAGTATSYLLEEATRVEDLLGHLHMLPAGRLTVHVPCSLPEPNSFRLITWIDGEVEVLTSEWQRVVDTRLAHLNGQTS